MAPFDLNAHYNRDQYLAFLRNEFLPEDFQQEEKTPRFTKDYKYIKDAVFLGESPAIGLKVYEIMHNCANDPRVSLTRETFHLMRTYNDFNALAIYITPASDNYRLSYVTIGAFLDDRKVKYEYPNPRRYSYFLGPGAKINTPHRYLIQKGRIKGVDDFQERFSVEVVNKEFYQGIAALFAQLVGGKLQLPSVSDHKKKQEFAVRMIGRVVFCWFLKKKSSPTGGPLIPEEILSLDAVKTNTNYYHTILEKLFFQVLNTPQEKRRDEFKSGPFANIPFLNGGLFEPHSDDRYEADPFFGESQYFNTLKVPDEWMEEFFKLLEMYHFTIDENTSMDVELSVDPEMLGRIFENLLAEINPETGETARKSTGSYYTPRPIVEYMVDESLKQYLKTQTGIDEKKLELLLSFSRELDEVEAAERPTLEEGRAIIDALDQVKIIDPACGSGAFPMGALQKLVLILEKIDPQSKLWLDKSLEKVPYELRQIARQSLQKENVNYIHKMGLIRSAIYGVDIQQIAVEISKLRVFLSLVVDASVEDDMPGNNRGIKPLPNLEFKFVCADTLRRLPQEGKLTQRGLFDDNDNIKKLKELREQYFNSFGHEKEKIREEFKQTQGRMWEQMKFHKFKGNMTLYLASWDPFSDKSSDWFESDWMFGVKDGFDIVIANPPYIQLSKSQDFSQSKKEYLLSQYSSTMGRFNTFGFFAEMGINLISNRGVLTYIIPNTILTQEYYQKIRIVILEKCIINEIWEIEQLPFDDAVVENIVLILSKKNISNKELDKVAIKNIDKDRLTFLRYVQQDWFTKTYKNSFNVNLTPQLLNLQIKMQQKSLLLCDIVDINQAIALKEDRSKNLSEKKMGPEYKPVLDGRNIERYCIRWSGDYLKYDITAIHSCKREDIFLSDEKIFFRRVGDKVIAAYDNKHYYALNTLVVVNLKPNSDHYDLKYILALLNSKLFSYYYMKFLKSTKKVFSEIQARQIAQLPIKKPLKDEQMVIIKYVDKIISAKNIKPDADTNNLEEEIDQLVYRLYHLTPEEITIIEKEIGDK